MKGIFLTSRQVAFTIAGELFLLASAIVLVATIVSANRMDVERGKAVAAYEQCVQQEYGMTPIKWYEEHQQYPLCGN
jgi:hypothetical protein